jgi:hypothetical protein
MDVCIKTRTSHYLFLFFARPPFLATILSGLNPIFLAAIFQVSGDLAILANPGFLLLLIGFPVIILLYLLTSFPQTEQTLM